MEALHVIEGELLCEQDVRSAGGHGQHGQAGGEHEHGHGKDREDTTTPEGDRGVGTCQGFAPGPQPGRQRLVPEQIRALAKNGTPALGVRGSSPTGRTVTKMPIDVRLLGRRQQSVEVGSQLLNGSTTLTHKSSVFS